ncbi:MAG: sigma-54-dependent Fis family transcriptional regulator [Rhodocyclaceae bacterium]|nr:MAG: sigma-54-dependent Fis family transcriptional regulator [Rhodocyclaceae bacterium]
MNATSSYAYPQNEDLRKLVHFSAKDGTIWLAENRMLLLHVMAVAGLRKELINSVGLEHARRIITRMGFASGTRDAELAKKIRGQQNPIDAFMVGPQLHMLEGSVKVSPIKLDMDIALGRFYGEFLWENSWESEAHTQEFGIQKDPVCWMLIGYASGYTTAFMGKFVLFKEVECTGCNDPHCRIVGKPVDEWSDADQFTPYFETDSIISQLLELRTQVDVLRSSIEDQYRLDNLIGESPAFKRAYNLVSRAAATNVTVLLTGETGVGKERFAHALHDLSNRKEGPFVAVNCAALPADLVESELFGVEKGAFTGAHASRAGKFERADGGTLFLDEIGELPLPAQAKLLRVLQEGELERLGDDKPRKINIRIVTATNVDLECAVKAGKFRSDLFYRLNVYPIAIPSLRERKQDIPHLANAMIKRFSTLHGKRVEGLSDKAQQALRSYQWPGNVRELENMIERGIILASNGSHIEVEDLFPNPEMRNDDQVAIDESGNLEPSSGGEKAPVSEMFFSSNMSLDAIETLLIEEAVLRAKGNYAGAARLLGITRPQLAYRLKKNRGGEDDKSQAATGEPTT